MLLGLLLENDDVVFGTANLDRSFVACFCHFTFPLLVNTTGAEQGLSSKALVRLVMDGDRVVGEERLLTNRNARIREVVQGPDGALYLLTDAEKGSLLKITPQA